MFTLSPAQRVLQLIVVFVLLSSACHAQGLKSEDIYKKSLPSSMTLMVEDKNGAKSIGTAFFAIKSGIAVTAWHVVKNAKLVSAKFSNGEEYEVSGLIDKDEKRDICLVRVKVFGRPILSLFPTEPIVGEKAYVIGSPQGLDFSISDGLLSQIQTFEGIKYYQFSCATSPGNSGGPLMNASGDVIGVVSWQLRDGQNLNFAVPSMYVLGLDATLPTQPWEQVKTQQPEKITAEQLTDEEFDSLLAQVVVTLIDWPVTMETIAIDISGTPNDGGWRTPRMPSLVYVTQNFINKAKPQLEAANVSGYRERIRRKFLAQLSIIEAICNHCVQAVTLAQKNHSWAGEPNNYLAKAYALETEFLFPEPSDIKLLFGTKAFSEKIPLDLQYNCGMLEDKARFTLGVSVLYRIPLYLARADESGFAYSLGLRSEDRLVGTDDGPFHTMQDVKLYLKGKLGKQIKLYIIRGDGKKMITITLPKELPKSCLYTD